MEISQMQARVAELAERWAQARPERQQRRSLDQRDFAELQEAGFLLTGVSAAAGGFWRSSEASARPVSEALRTLARGDPSVALVSAMHPAVLSFWLARPQAPQPYARAWAEQAAWAGETALGGAWWGTITSEPGSGGDVANSRAAAVPAGGDYEISGQKHFGSGSGISSYMLTSALPEGEQEADWFYFDMRGVPWDGSRGLRLIAEWDGHGMAATQSHAFDFKAFPATRFAWPHELRGMTALGCGAFVTCCFTAVVTGVLEAAVEAARTQLSRKRQSLRPYEQVEWTRAETEAWLARQAYEGMLRAVEAGGSAALLETLRAKTAVAQLAESVTGRICKIIGGGTFGRGSPFGFWFEDVRALGFLRPPWGLAFDQMWQLGWPGD
jgi:alkylation response protein AidB-like acyl-CoA dehydrogenase